RMVLAPEGYSVAGPEGAYLFHALSADAEVLDATATSPSPGVVIVSILSRLGDGTASAQLVDTVQAYVSADDRRPLTDFVTVQSAQIVPYAVVGELNRTFCAPSTCAARNSADMVMSRPTRWLSST
ncbi:baseplate J/gp47 family protein, partial [Novosphingobium guangzhouense]|uniref:baseplate J/gp47 family protein n=1 Tax=Novosphingobium guangzhouense TaxID=1850347 RepID=UPI001B806D90